MGLIAWIRRRFGGARVVAQGEGSPLDGFDVRLDGLAHRAALLRRATAGLLSLRAELRQAGAGRGAGAADDLADTLRRIDDDAKELLAAAEQLELEREELHRERLGAQAVVSGARAVAAARGERETARVRELLALDDARDAVERHRALAAIYEEDRRQERAAGEPVAAPPVRARD